MVLKLAANLDSSEQNGKPEAMKKTSDYISRLARECQTANVLRAKEAEFTSEFIAWIENELKRKFTFITEDKSISTLSNVCTNRPKSIEPVFYNIVYCVLERYGVLYRHKSRKRILSFDEYCTVTGNNRKTLSRGATIFYTPQKVREIWLQNDEDGGLLLEIIIKIANEIAEKINEF